MTVIDESLTARGFTPAGSVPLVYGMQRLILGITIHHWGAFGQTHDGVNNFFVNGPGATSAHFVASGYPRPRINCLVSPADAAWHAGNARGNATTIGIECRPEATEADYRVVAELVRFLRDTYGANLPLFPHRYWQATACPGQWDLAKIDRMAEAMKKPAASTAPKPTPKPTPIQPKPPVKEDMKVTHERVVIPANMKFPVANKAAALWRPGKAGVSNGENWNLAVQGLGYYDCDVFIQGTGLGDGETLTVQGFIVTGGGKTRSGYFPQEIHGSADGKFHGVFRLKTPLLSTARLEIEVQSTTTTAVVTNYGADVFAFHA
jgi:hypothetical protein